MATARTETRPDGSIVEYDAANRVVSVTPSPAAQGKQRGQERRAFRDAYLDQPPAAATEEIEARPQPTGQISGSSVARSAAVAQNPGTTYGTGINSERIGVTPAGLPAGESAEQAADDLLTKQFPKTKNTNGPDRAANIAAAKSDGSFELKRTEFNQANTGKQAMDLDGNIAPVAGAASTPAPFELTYQKANGKFYGETREGKGQEFDTQDQASAFSRGPAVTPAPSDGVRSIDTFTPAQQQVMERPVGSAAGRAFAPAPAPTSAPVAVAAPAPAPIQPGRVAPSGSGFAPRGRGIQPAAPAVVPVIPVAAPAAPVISRAQAMTNAQTRAKRPPALDLAQSPVSAAPSPVMPYDAPGNPVSAAPSLDLAESPVVPQPVIDAGPQPGIPDEPEGANIDLPPLRRPATRGRARASIREPQF